MKSLFSSTAKASNHYETLGVSPQASKADIKSSFYRLSKEHHPDVSKDPSSEQVFRAVSEAYTVLSNDRHRRAYDRKLQQAQTAASTPPTPPPRPPPPRPSRRYTYSEWQEKRRTTVHYASEFSSRPNSSHRPPPGWSQAHSHPVHPQSHGGHYTGAHPGQRPRTHAQQAADMAFQRGAEMARSHVQTVSSSWRAIQLFILVLGISTTVGLARKGITQAKTGQNHPQTSSNSDSQSNTSKTNDTP